MTKKNELQGMVEHFTKKAERIEVPGYDALSDLGKAEFASTGVMPSTPATANVAATPELVSGYLSDLAQDLVDLQHARAAAGNGTATHWQNAQAHIHKAIECIEQQAEADRVAS